MKKRIVLLFIIITSLSACKETNLAKKSPIAKDGIIDLRQWDFDKDGITKLNGEWKFYWKKFYFNDELKSKELEQSSSIIKLPASWNGHKVRNEVLGGFGYATYSLKILLNESKKNIFFKFPTVGSAFDFYINGKKIKSAGKVGTSPKETYAKYAPGLVDYTPETNELDIVVHVSNFSQKFGGLWYSLEVGTLKDLSTHRDNNVFMEIFMIGVFIIMALYYLALLALRTDDKLPLYFALFCFILAIRILVLGEFLILSFFPDISLANIKRLQYLTYFLAVPAIGAFMGGSFPKDIHKISTPIVTVISSVFSLIVIFTDSSFFTFIITYFQLYCFFLIFYYVYAFVLVIKRKRIGGTILAIGAFSFFLATVNDILYMRGIIYTFNTYQFGVLMFIFSQSLLMSKRFAMAFRTVEKLSLDLEVKNTELSDLNQNLEEKVLERTEELEAANQEMIVINQDLIRTRDSLWGEMQLAKKIQTVLLPESPEIDGYEIAAHMTPADDVGGDYYDIINVAGYDWVVIGDVSGHGVPAGIVMMMVQTSIHSTLEQNPGINPSELLALVNRTIRNNILRLGEDKYMTITVFMAIKDGELSFSGLHQDIIIYRSEAKNIEIVETNGFWLGLEDDIDSMLINETVSVNSGDVMLLYTDGITESWKKEISEVDGKQEEIEKMYGEAKLERVFKESCKKFANKSAPEIKKNILDSLENYVCEDDVTFVVLKKV